MALEDQVVEIVAAYTKRNQLPANQLPTLITTVHRALTHLGSPPAEPPQDLVPAVSIRRSIQPDAITCLDCGKHQKMIKRHLMTAHNLTEAQYRERWKLPLDYPLVAPSYAARRSEFAKSIGLGKRREAAG